MIDIFYTHFPHYREAVFREIIAVDPNVAIYCDVGGGDASIKTGKFSEIKKIKTVRIGPLIFQLGVLQVFLVNNKRNAIFLANPANITIWLCLILNKIFSRKKVFLWTHGYYHNQNSFSNRVKDVFYSLASGLLVYSEYAKEICNSRISTSSHSIGNSIDDSKIFFDPRFQEKDLVFLFSGRLTEAVNLEWGFKAIHLSGRKDIKIIVVGSGPQEHVLRKLGNRYGLNASFVGAIYEEDALGQLFNEADYILSPGKIGLLQVHANLYGVPTITHNSLRYQMPEATYGIQDFSTYYFSHDDLQSLQKLILGLEKTPLRTKTEIREKAVELYSASGQARLIYGICVEDNS